MLSQLAKVVGLAAAPDAVLLQIKAPAKMAEAVDDDDEEGRAVRKRASTDLGRADAKSEPPGSDGSPPGEQESQGGGGRAKRGGRAGKAPALPCTCMLAASQQAALAHCQGSRSYRGEVATHNVEAEQVWPCHSVCLAAAADFCLELRSRQAATAPHLGAGVPGGRWPCKARQQSSCGLIKSSAARSSAHQPSSLCAKRRCARWTLGLS